ncbi:3-oxoacyl-[acyl-carrier protein] reductase [Stackebrandtia endophytica]|uniref:3-oxoacyl-[acyl-carrier protein] reductase n=1 Tax=Stackebrandtia endophytica TaxID=1496996 RepID=A0A543ARJ2_9ACTN|nr:SDR family oxidoreductase [Stackebrandtia endophytica]TQL75194.1 3-oxoacyl-[acyl-carrier protein] reductase [Stackebrandtia endophytica]
MTRHILVTGGGTGLGAAIAERFVAGGDTVVITGRRADVLNQTAAKLGDAVIPIVCDHTDPHQLDRLVEQLPSTVDVLVNNAGGVAATRDSSSRLEKLAADWQANLAVNLISAVLTSEAVLDRLPDDGRIISLGSIAADTGGGSYGAAKAALETWNQDLATKVGSRGVTANVLSPGYTVDTEFFGDSMNRQRHEKLIRATRLDRAGLPADIAAAAWFLASTDARHITAQVLKVNGGAWPAKR